MGKRKKMPYHSTVVYLNRSIYISNKVLGILNWNRMLSHQSCILYYQSRCTSTTSIKNGIRGCINESQLLKHYSSHHLDYSLSGYAFFINKLARLKQPFMFSSNLPSPHHMYVKIHKDCIMKGEALNALATINLLSSSMSIRESFLDMSIQESISKLLLLKTYDLSGNDLAYTIQLYAKAGSNNKHIWQLSSKVLKSYELQNATKTKANLLSPKHLSNIVNAYAKIGIQSEKLFGAKGTIEIETLKKINEFNSQDLARTIWSYAKLGIQSQTLFNQIILETLKKIDQFNSHEMANTIWAFAKLGIKSETLFDAIEVEIVKKVNKFNSRDLTNTIWAYAKLGIQSQVIFDAIKLETLKQINLFNVHEMANTIWAFAKLGIKSETLFGAIEQEIVKKVRVHQFNSQDLANIVWAYTKFEIRSEKLIGVSERIMLKNINQFDPKTLLVNILTSYAKHGIKSDAVFDISAHIIANKINKFNLIDLSYIVTAYAEMRIRSELVFGAIEKEIVKIVGQFNPTNLSHIVKAYAKVEMRSELLFDVVEKEIVKKIVEFSSANLFNTLTSYGKMGIKLDIITINCIEQEILKNSDKCCRKSNLVKIFLAFGVLGIESDVLAGVVEKEIIQNKSKSRLHIQDLSDIIFVFSLWEKPASVVGILNKFFIGNTSTFTQNELDCYSSAQIYQGLLEMKLSDIYMGVELEKLYEFCRNKLYLENCRKNNSNNNFQHSSDLHSIISGLLLDGLKLKHTNEFYAYESCRTVDIKLDGLWKDSNGIVKQLCIEVDGPTHFYNDGTTRVATLMKNRHLRGFGWHVISLPHWAWLDYSAEKSKEQNYIKILEESLREYTKVI